MRQQPKDPNLDNDVDFDDKEYDALIKAARKQSKVKATLPDDIEEFDSEDKDLLRDPYLRRSREPRRKPELPPRPSPIDQQKEFFKQIEAVISSLEDQQKKELASSKAQEIYRAINAVTTNTLNSLKDKDKILKLLEEVALGNSDFPFLNDLVTQAIKQLYAYEKPANHTSEATSTQNLEDNKAVNTYHQKKVILRDLFKGLHIIGAEARLRLKKLTFNMLSNNRCPITPEQFNVAYGLLFEVAQEGSPRIAEDIMAYIDENNIKDLDLLIKLETLVLVSLEPRRDRLLPDDIDEFKKLEAIEEKTQSIIEALEVMKKREQEAKLEQ